MGSPSSSIPAGPRPRDGERPRSRPAASRRTPEAPGGSVRGLLTSARKQNLRSQRNGGACPWLCACAVSSPSTMPHGKRSPREGGRRGAGTGQAGVACCSRRMNALFFPKIVWSVLQITPARPRRGEGSTPPPPPPERGPASGHRGSQQYGHHSPGARPWVRPVVKIKCLPQRSDIRGMMRTASDETASVLLCVIRVVKGQSLNVENKNNEHRMTPGSSKKDKSVAAITLGKVPALQCLHKRKKKGYGKSSCCFCFVQQ